MKRKTNTQHIGDAMSDAAGTPLLTPEVVKRLVAASAPRSKNQNDSMNAARVLDHLIYHSSCILEKHGRKFHFDGPAENLLKLVACYFSEDDRWVNYQRSDTHRLINEYSTKKGLLFAGSTGLGKSLTMRAAAMSRIPGKEFVFNPANSVVTEYESDGPKRAQKFFLQNRCFDDFGTEPRAIWYGKQHEFFRPLLEARYNEFINTGLITHMTTNLTIDAIGKRYGAHIESRLYEQYNIIVMAGTDRRKK